MNRLSRTIYLPLLVIAFAACDHEHIARHNRSARTKTITRTWPAAEIRQLEVFEVGGSVRVEAGPANEISMVATVEGRDLDAKAGMENDGLFQTKLEGDTLRIGRKDHKRRGINIPFLFERKRIEIDYVLKVPATVSLDLATVNGRIVTRGTDAETEASTVNGSIDIETSGAHELQATTVNGRVKATFTQSFQGARFKSVNGGVEAVLPQAASFRVDLSQVNGDFEATFPLSISSNPGSRRVSGEVNGGEHALKITTVNGDVELSRPGDDAR